MISGMFPRGENLSIYVIMSGHSVNQEVYLNYAGVACGCLWVDGESIRLEDHSGWGEHSPKTTHEEMRNGGKWEEKESRGKGRVDVHTEEQAIRLEFFFKKGRKNPKWRKQKLQESEGGGKKRPRLRLLLHLENEVKQENTRETPKTPGKDGI